MAHIRFRALEVAQNRKALQVEKPEQKVSEYFGVNVFDKRKMKSYLSSEVYAQLVATIDSGAKIDPSLADAAATGMKTWAMEKGATHFTHWFQPLRGNTAEKHDSFFNLDGEGMPLEKFKGSTLVQQEPDASSFPSGGLRNTFEARGYTAWDPTSPAFLMPSGGGFTLCIPSVFVAYTGQALDNKAPLLKSLDLVNRAATEVCQYFDKNVTKVTATLGAEQEFFLIDKAFYNARPDLLMSGRSVLGHSPARGQQLDDHYFGTIPTRVKRFIREMEVEAWKLGIPITTRHNEVAPGQYEFAPVFEETNLAVDHNLLLMDIMNKVADKHELALLFHEKPFANVNGSGKHNNWALSTNTGRNLLAPSTKPKENLQFLTFFVNTIKAVHTHADLLRASIATAGNDFRLGANEAPPAIMSVFIGSQLTELLDRLESHAEVTLDKGENMYMKLGIDKIPPILLDNTDRNRTSPFAFTGNKFEFRAVGSSANNSLPMMTLNTIVADQLVAFKKEVDVLIEKGQKKELALIEVLRKLISESKAIRFEGNNYGDEWVKEAEKRGLSNVKNTPEAYEVYHRKETLELFARHDIFTASELEARQEIKLEKYLMQVQIEARMLGDLAQNHIVPAALAYQNQLIKNLKGLAAIGLTDDTEMRKETLRKISGHVETITQNLKAMIKERKRANELPVSEAAKAYAEKVKPYFDPIREACDKLELLVDDELWPLPKYREMLFMR